MDSFSQEEDTEVIREAIADLYLNIKIRNENEVCPHYSSQLNFRFS
jgi:hypothetical protein